MNRFLEQERLNDLREQQEKYLRKLERLEKRLDKARRHKNRLLDRLIVAKKRQDEFWAGEPVVESPITEKPKKNQRAAAWSPIASVPLIDEDSYQRQCLKAKHERNKMQQSCAQVIEKIKRFRHYSNLLEKTASNEHGNAKNQQQQQRIDTPTDFTNHSQMDNLDITNDADIVQFTSIPAIHQSIELPSSPDHSQSFFQNSLGFGSSEKRAFHTRKAQENRLRTYRPWETNADGTVTVPAKYGPVTVISLGKIDYEDPAYHSERYIFPVDYHIERKFLSMIDAGNDDVVYTCKILRGTGGSGPLYEVRASDHDTVYTGRSSSGAWTPIFNTAYTIRNKSGTAVCGPDLFGFTCPEIAKMIQDLPNSDKCQRYKKQIFKPKKSASSSTAIGPSEHL